jgi:sirohydrochlorin cobaltochelatase
LVARSLEKIPGMVWEQAQHLGNHPAILQQSAARFQEAVMSRQPIASEQTLLVLVGRGSTDEQAIQAMHEFAAAAPQAARAVRTMVCFYAMASPSLDETLERAARAGCRRVVVQPHLLFEGQIAERIRESVRVAQLQRPEIEWIVANPLGPTELVAQAVAGRAKNPSCPPVNSPGLPQDEPRDGNQTKALKVAF